MSNEILKSFELNEESITQKGIDGLIDYMNEKIKSMTPVEKTVFMKKIKEAEKQGLNIKKLSKAWKSVKESVEIDESTSAANVPAMAGPTGKMPCGSPYFDCTDDMFWNLHQRKRKNGGWYDKFYVDSDVADWARKNKGKGFYLKHGDMFRKIKAR